MSKKPELLSSDPDDLFRQAMQDVTPLPASERIEKVALPVHTKEKHTGIKRPAPVSQAISVENFSDHGALEIPLTSFIRPGLNNMTLRKLRRGTWPVQDEIDLHGNTLEQARSALYRFLHHAVNNGYRCVNVIHGKGWQAGGNEGVLKIHTRHWLPQFPDVMAFCEPPLNAGGSGAVWVLLKSSGQPRID